MEVDIALVAANHILQVLEVDPLVEHLVEHLGRSSRSLGLGQLRPLVEVKREGIIKDIKASPLEVLAVACQAYLEHLAFQRALDLPKVATLGFELRKLEAVLVMEDKLLAFLVTGHKDLACLEEHP